MLRLPQGDAQVATGSITLTILPPPPKAFIAGRSATRKLPIQPSGLNDLSSLVISVYLMLVSGVAVQTPLFSVGLF